MLHLLCLLSLDEEGSHLGFHSAGEDEEELLTESSDEEDAQRDPVPRHSSRSSSRSPSQGALVRPHPKKKKKKKKQQQQEREVDKSPTRPPLSTAHVENLHAKRLNNHPNITVTRPGNKKKAGSGGESRSIMDRNGRRKSPRLVQARKKDPNAHDSDYSQNSHESLSDGSESGSTTRGLPTNKHNQHGSDQENDQRLTEELQCKVAMLQERLKSQGKKTAKSGSESAMVKEVKKMTKEVVWCEAKVITNEEKLLEKTEMLLPMMDIRDFAGPKGTALQNAKAHWVCGHKEHVRIQINEMRNYHNGQPRDLHRKEVFKNGELLDSHALVADSHPDLSFCFRRQGR